MNFGLESILTNVSTLLIFFQFIYSSRKKTTYNYILDLHFSTYTAYNMVLGQVTIRYATERTMLRLIAIHMKRERAQGIIAENVVITEMSYLKEYTLDHSVLSPSGNKTQPFLVSVRISSGAR